MAIKIVKCEICSRSAEKIPKRCNWFCFDLFTVIFEQMYQIYLACYRFMFLLCMEFNSWFQRKCRSMFNCYFQKGKIWRNLKKRACEEVYWRMSKYALSQISFQDFSGTVIQEICFKNTDESPEESRKV